MLRSKELAYIVFSGIVDGTLSRNAVEQLIADAFTDERNDHQATYVAVVNDRLTVGSPQEIANQITEASVALTEKLDKVKARLDPARGILTRKPRKNKRGHFWVRAAKNEKGEVIKTGYWAKKKPKKAKKAKAEEPAPKRHGKHARDMTAEELRISREKGRLGYYRKRAKDNGWPMPTTVAEGEAQNVIKGEGMRAAPGVPVERAPSEQKAAAVRLYQPRKRANTKHVRKRRAA